MKRFHFRLQTLLEQRKAKEDRRMTEFGELKQEEAKEVKKLQELNQKLEDAAKSLESVLKKGKHTEEIALWDGFAKVIRDDIRVQFLTIEAVRKNVEAKRQELVIAMQDRKVLEALRDKQEREYIAAAEKAEQNEMDDMTAIRYAREA
jgi:flagellar protein FliJ